MENSAGARALYEELRTLAGRAKSARAKEALPHSPGEAVRQLKERHPKLLQVGGDRSLSKRIGEWLDDDRSKATTPSLGSEAQLLAVVEVWCKWSKEPFTKDTRNRWKSLLEEAQPRRAGAHSNRARASASTGIVTDPFDQVIRDLAGLVRSELRDELDGLQVYRPYPLPVCGQAAPKDDVRGMYRRTPAGRLVILGEPGSGKSVLALRLARELIDNHTAGAPVPVVFALRTWSEPTTGWRQWLADSLAERYPQYPQLREQRNGHITLARELVNHDRILPVLDGLDELPAQLRAAAIRQLPSDGPVIVTSTAEGYTAAVEAAGPVPGATEITLGEIDSRELARYLPQSSPADWTPVVEPPDSQSPAATAVREALRTPLMITLAREVYRANPSELLDVAADGGCAAVERNLLNEFIPAVYSEELREPQRKRRRSSREWHTKDEEDRETTLRYVRALAKLAADERSGGILAWWRLYATVPRGFRALAIGTFYLIAGLVAAALAQGAYSWTGGSGTNVLLWSLPAVAAGAAICAVQGLRDKTLPAPVYVRLRFRGRTLKVLMESVLVLLIAKSSLVFVKATATVTGQRDVLVLAIAISWGLGLAIASTYMLRRFLEGPLELDAVPSTPATLAAARHSLLLASAIALVSTALGLGGVAMAAFHYTPWALMVVAVAAPVRVATAVLSTAYGRFCFVTRPYFALTGRLPWPVVDFLDDAACRGVLRQVGPVYVFHHGLLLQALLDGSSSSQQDAVGREDGPGDGQTPGAGVREGGIQRPSAN